MKLLRTEPTVWNLCPVWKFMPTYTNTLKLFLQHDHILFSTNSQNHIPCTHWGRKSCIMCRLHFFSESPWLIIRNLLVAQISIAYVWIRIFGYASSSMTECRPGPTLSQTAQMCQSLYYTHKHTTKHKKLHHTCIQRWKATQTDYATQALNNENWKHIPKQL